jgi:phytoene desaturase
MDKISNLYLCGAGVHPGGGVPGVVTSAKVVEGLVKRAFPAPLKTPTNGKITEVRSVA